MSAPTLSGVSSAANTTGSVLLRYDEVLARYANWGLIGSGFAQNYRRDDASTNVAMATQQPFSSGGMVLAGGSTVSALRMIPSVVIASPLHQFVALYDARSLARLAVGTDVTTQAMTINVDISFPISYTPTNTIEVLCVYYCEATTAPSFYGKASFQAGVNAPRFGGGHTTLAAGSGPANLPTTLTNVSASRGPFWVQAE